MIIIKLKKQKIFSNTSVILIIIGSVLGFFEINNFMTNYRNDKINKTQINWVNQALSESLSNISSANKFKDKPLQSTSILKPIMINNYAHQGAPISTVIDEVFSYNSGQYYDLIINSSLAKHKYTAPYNIKNWKIVNVFDNRDKQYAIFANKAIQETALNIIKIIKPNLISKQTSENDFKIINNFKSFLDNKNLISNSGVISATIGSQKLGLKISCKIACPIVIIPTSSSTNYDKNFWKLTNIRPYN